MPETTAADPLPVRGTFGDVLDVALVIPLDGPAGILGPSCELCALLAVEELNAGTGVLGRQVRLTVVDGAADPEQVAAQTERLVVSRQVDAVVGWHISAVRQALAPRVAPHVPYVYSALYEGGERTPGVFLTGETPRHQLRPAIRWLVQALGVRRWAVVGDDYVWPVLSAARARRYLRECGAELRDAVFVPLGTEDFSSVLQRVERSECDAVLMLLVGQDAVQFNRQFARAGLDQRCVRLSPLMDENMLLASGSDSTSGLYAAAGYFESLTTADSLEFSGRFTARFGAEAPVLSSPGESCYEAVRLLAALVQRAGTPDVRAVSAVADTAGYDGPRGSVQLQGNHLGQQVYLARAAGLEFDVLEALTHR